MSRAAKPTTRLNSRPDLPGRRVRRRWGRFTILLALLVVLVWQRSLWWSPGWRMLAQRALAAREFDAALKYLDWASCLRTGEYENELLRARIYRKQGQMEAVADALKRANSLGAPADRVRREQWLALAQSGQMHKAQPHYAELLTRPGDDGEEICEAFVVGYLRTLRFAEALTLLNAWIADWPASSRPYLLRGQIQVLQQQSPSAEKDLRQAIALAPRDPEINFEMGLLLKDGNRPEEAIPYFEACLHHSKTRKSALVGLAVCVKIAGDEHRATKLLEMAVAEFPADPEVLRELARLRHEAGHPVSAIPLLEAALQITPYDDECHYLLAQALQTSGQPEKAGPHFEYTRRAREAFRRMNLLQDELRHDPANTDALVGIGEIMLKFASPDEGVVRLLAALDLNPSNQAAHRLLADYYDDRARTDSRFRELANAHRQWLKPTPGSTIPEPDTRTDR